MSTSTIPKSIQIMLRHPDASIRLAVPTDLPLGELMPDFLDVAELPDGDDGALSPDGRQPVPEPEDVGRARRQRRRGARPVRTARRGKADACHTRSYATGAHTPRAGGSAEVCRCRASPKRADRPHAARQALRPQPAAGGPWGH